MDRHEYARAGQLLDRYPHLDTTERRRLLHDGISRYEDTMLDSAQAKAGNDNLVDAIGVRARLPPVQESTGLLEALDDGGLPV